ncbi:hypothetical protein [Fibrella forsythiae]|uniref:Uncharacterized protein n=1 Tax=Fibrella forsythiae TaxID=2817061 RepID=A0ABS3JGR8_9BACT|nr:hypothetical protein [Fibrella forsythiae]MBO0949208.1 hypothetical protein [Fibrella forsythiae]
MGVSGLLSPILIRNSHSFDELSIDNYKIVLEKISKNSLSIPIQNNEKKHAAILMRYIFNETKEELGLYVNRFSGVYSSHPEYLENLKNCLDRKITVNLLLDSEPNLDSEAYNLIANYIQDSGRGKIGIATDNSRSKIGILFKESKPLHFAVSDSKRYRIEIDPVSKAAYAHFNDNEMAENLKECLNEALVYSHPI